MARSLAPSLPAKYRRRPRRPEARASTSVPTSCRNPAKKASPIGVASSVSARAMALAAAPTARLCSRKPLQPRDVLAVEVERSERLGRENQRLDRVQAEQADRLGGVGNPLRRPEEAGADQLQDLRRHAHVAGYDLGDPRQRRPRRAEFGDKLGVGRRVTGHRRRPRHHARVTLIDHAVAQVARSGDRGLEGLGVAGLGEELMGGSDALQHGLAIALARQDDPHGRGIASHDRFQKLRAVRARHAHVGDHHVEGRGGEAIQRLAAAFGELHLPLAAETPEHAAQPFEHLGFVIDEQDPLHPRSPRLTSAGGSCRQNVLGSIGSPARSRGRRRGRPGRSALPSPSRMISSARSSSYASL